MPAANASALPDARPDARPAALPAGIEIFRAGRHIDDAGDVHSFGEADVQAMAESYNPALREAPLTVGHPKDNLPAYGWVESLARNAQGRLVMNTRHVEPQFAEMVAQRRFPKRSASFYPPNSPNNPTPGKWYLRHVAFLGAQPPAIAGLKDIQFSEDEAGGAVSFSESFSAEQEQEDMSKELQEQLAKTQAELQAAKDAQAKAEAQARAAQDQAKQAQEAATSFAEKARADRKAGFVSFAQAQVKAGTLLPKDQDMAVATLEVLADAQPVEFAEGDGTRKVSPSQWLQELIGSARPQVSFGEFAGGKPAQAGSAKGKSDAEIDQEAHAYARQHSVSYAEALSAVTSSFTS